MNKPDNIPESQTEHYALLCEIKELRAELEKLKRQWAEDDRDITELEDENNQLRAELAAEREKNDDLAFRLQDWHDSAEKAWKTPCADESHCSCVPLLRKTANDLEAQVEVLREHMTGWLNHYGWRNGEYIDNLEEYFSEALANLPARAAAVRKVLDAADKAERGLKHRQYVESQYTDLDELFKRVHELRGTK